MSFSPDTYMFSIIACAAFFNVHTCISTPSDFEKRNYRWIIDIYLSPRRRVRTYVAGRCTGVYMCIYRTYMYLYMYMCVIKKFYIFAYL